MRDGEAGCHRRGLPPPDGPQQPRSWASASGGTRRSGDPSGSIGPSSPRCPGQEARRRTGVVQGSGIPRRWSTRSPWRHLVPSERRSGVARHGARCDAAWGARRERRAAAYELYGLLALPRATIRWPRPRAGSTMPLRAAIPGRRPGSRCEGSGGRKKKSLSDHSLSPPASSRAPEARDPRMIFWVCCPSGPCRRGAAPPTDHQQLGVHLADQSQDRVGDLRTAGPGGGPAGGRPGTGCAERSFDLVGDAGVVGSVRSWSSDSVETVAVLEPGLPGSLA